ncbi:MAG: TetR/AcrR family transcriptional regulator [Sneathiella sp.]|nr:TetR/AcrR family transcriptional regulator [Sneathiella sp.]
MLTKKEQTKLRMLDAASRSFRSHGFAGIGVDGIAKVAGVTSGAFYAHLGSKNKAFEAILIMGLDEVIESVPKFQHEFKTEWVQAFADYYLESPHIEDLECGCAMASLTSEVVRSDTKLQAIYEQKMSQITNLMIDGLADGDDAEKKARAWTLLSTLIGGLNIVRAIGDDAIAQNIATSIKSAVVKAAGKTR